METPKGIIALLIAITIYWDNCSAADTLFENNEHITQMSGLNNFTATVVGSRYAWIIDFYSSWCGHCQRFVPTWVDLARNLRGWQSVVRVGAVACSDPRNNALCRQYNVWAYPTVKFFPSGTSAQNKGYTYTGTKTMEVIRNAVIDYLNEQTTRGSGLPLRPVRSVGEVRALKELSTRALFLVAIEDTQSGKRMAKGTILDMSSRYPEIVVAWSHRNLMRTYSNIAPYPSVHRVTDTAMTRINGKGEFVAIITQQSDEPEETTTRATTTRSTTTRSTTTRSTTASTVSVYTPTTTLAYIPSDGLHSQDLDSGVYYSFWVEIAAQRRINRKSLRALKRHVYIMAKFYSGSSHVVKFLRRVHNWLSTVRAPLRGSEWVANITSLQKRNAYVPQKVEWTGCKGSLTKYRGYPCSLWMTFHSLTVNAYLHHVNKQRNHPRAVLLAMREYVRNFMGCRMCASHFTNGMAANIERDVKKPRDGVLFLWRNHNLVNKFLHNDPTEDPNNPKIQFPAASVCPNCRRYGAGRFNHNVTWGDEQVLNYMLDFYKPDNIIRDSVVSTFQGRTMSRSMQNTEPNRCRVNNTDWSKCSKSCGTGVSSRVSNDNAHCKPKLQFRLCVLRPCKAKVANGNSMPKTCKQNNNAATFRGLSKTRLVYGNCRSVNKYIWRYCGQCPGQCCRPTDEQTVSIPMECKENKKWYTTKADVMKIIMCTCDEKC